MSVRVDPALLAAHCGDAAGFRFAVFREARQDAYRAGLPGSLLALGTLDSTFV